MQSKPPPSPHITTLYVGMLFCYILVIKPTRCTNFLNLFLE